MTFATMNYLAVFAAAVVAFVIGAVFYSLLSNPWMKAARVTPGDNRSPMAFLLIHSFVLELVMAFITAGVMGHVGAITPTNGIVTGFLIWLGFIVTTMSINHRYEGYGWDLTIIDGLHWLLVMLGIGVTIGLFG